jgi:serine/threonine-protein kinase
VSIGSAYAPGDRIADRYQLLRMLDQGGMGVVWVAHHLALDVHVALKLVRPEAGSAHAADRLLVEAQAAARLNHPAILRVIDVGKTASGDPFLVMELLEGECLADVIEREEVLDPVTTVRTILPIADALDAMHGKGILHRDVKPENIFLARTDSGRWQPKVIDFGVAKLEQRATRRITRRGMAVGTPSYMSPEQLKGEEVDGRADVWALSVVLYETLTGALPFEAETHVLLLMALLGNNPRPLSAHGVDDDELWAIVRRGLAPLDERWPSVRALGEALARWLWARGVTHDITGVALRSGWLDAREAPEPPRLAPTPPPGETPPAPPPRDTPPAPAPRLRPRVEATKELAVRPSSPAPARLLTPERRVPPPSPARAPAAGGIPLWQRIALGMWVAALVAGALVLWWPDRGAPPARAAGEPSALPAAAASVTAATPPVINSAEASTSAPDVPSATAPPSASAAPRPRGKPPAALPSGLKDPFR